MVGSLVLLFAGMQAHSATHVKPLPAGAKITVNKQHMLPGYQPEHIPPDYAPFFEKCPSRVALTAQQVRRMFASYHVVSGSEYHDFYAQEGCVTDGEIEADGKKFKFTYQPVNNLSTDWPDGVDKMLGGKHSADPSGK